LQADKTSIVSLLISANITSIKQPVRNAVLNLISPSGLVSSSIIFVLKTLDTEGASLSTSPNLEEISLNKPDLCRNFWMPKF
jgi:hypothetical protein